MDRFFRLKERGTTVQREFVAGLTTFLTMAYILAVNPAILSEAGISAERVFTATALSSAIATMIMAFTANLPIALAPGMGINAFFSYTVVKGMGYTWQIALTAVFLEGILFIILSMINVRNLIIKAIPASLKRGAAGGIGLFITLIGFTNAQIVVSNAGTIVSFGEISGGPPLLAFIGLLITIVLYANRIPGSILIGILVTAFIGTFMGVTNVPEGFSFISFPAAPVLAQFDFSQIISFKFFIVFFTFLFVDIFDTVGTLVGVTTQAGLFDKDGEIPRVKQALLSDAIGTVAGAVMGTSTVTSYIESSAGVAVGGRTGLASLFTGIFFILALFFSNLFLLIPSSATAPALIVVGFLMMQAVTEIDFKDPTEGIPAFITIVIMPLSYSIADGLVYGLLSFVLLKTFTMKFKDVSVISWILFLVFILRFVLRIIS